VKGSDERTPKGFRRNAELFVFLLLLIASSLMLVLSTRSFVLNVKEIGFSLFSGARNGISSVGAFGARTVAAIQELSDLRKEYSELVKRIEYYEVVQRDAAEIRRENLQLREQLGFLETSRYRQIPARVIGRDPDNLFSAFVIDKGSKHGIKRNMCVIAYQDGQQGLVGKTVQVGRSQTLVMPIYDASAFVSARFSASRYEGIVTGLGSADTPLLMRYIKKRAKDEIRFGDMVSTSGMGGIYPKDLVIGRVTKLVFQDYETSINAELEPAIDFSRLEYVFAMERYQDEEEAAQ
jgi:rod shape-determining protein MreC